MSKRSKKSADGLGVRYGRTVRKRWSTIVQNLKLKSYCQRCGTQSVQRTSVGIWQCRKCGFTFAGGAYSPTSKMGDVAKRTAKA